MFKIGPYTWGKTSELEKAFLPVSPSVASEAIQNKQEIPSREIFEEVKREMLSEIARGMPAMAAQGQTDPYMQMQIMPKTVPGAYGMENPWRFVTNMSPKRHPDSLVSTDTLRSMAANYDILRSCIMHLQREVSTWGFEVAPVDPTDDSAETMRQLKEAKAFFTKKGGLGGFGINPSTFENEWIEELTVIGACAFFRWPDRIGRTLTVTNVQADTIKPLITPYGWPAFGSDEDAYEQWIQGLRVQSFNRRELTYDGLFKRTTSPYYWSPVEFLILVVKAALSADAWNRNWLTDGNIPDTLISVPDTWTPSQIEQYSAWFDDLLSGDLQNRARGKFVPGGFKVLDPKSRTDQQFQEFEMWLARRTSAIVGVNLVSIGFADGNFKSDQDSSRDATTAYGTGTLLNFRKVQYDEFLGEMGLDRVQTINAQNRNEKPLDRAQRHQTEINSGKSTINECRAEDGKPPHPDGDDLLINSTMIPVKVAKQAQAQGKEPTSSQDNRSK